MKQRNLIALLAAMLLQGLSASAIEQIDGVYQIGTAEDMTAFAELVNGGATAANAVLTADIDWTEASAMIASFSGVLDGQGHSITINISGGEDGANYVAFVRELDGGTLQNLILKGSLASASLFAGGIVGHTKNNAVLRNVVSEIDMSQIGTAGVAAFGGFVGHIENTLIENCIFVGSIRTVGNSTSGVTGWADYLEMHNCAVIGDIEVGDPTQCFADSRGSNIVQDNFYYKTPLSGTFLPATQVTDEQIESGELCFLLNGDVRNHVWRQTLDEDSHPYPFEFGHKDLYGVGHFNCGGTTTSMITYSNNASDCVVDEHKVENGVCIVCGKILYYVPSTDEEGFYLLGSSTDFTWFAAKTETDPSVCARLTADIDWSEQSNMIANYSGVLDGQGHSITVNISSQEGANYVAFVRELDGGTLQNLILKGSLASASLFAGGIAGHTKNNAVLRNIVSEIDMSQIGTAEVAAFGGFVGHIENTLIENCIFAGSIRTVGNSTSGVTGWADYLEMHNCAVIGDIEVGNLNACFADSRGSNIVQENFYYKTPLSGTFLPATQVTDEQIESGALCCMLNGKAPAPVFFQTLNKDSHPVPFDDHGMVLPIYTSEGYIYVMAMTDDDVPACRTELGDGEMYYAASVVCGAQAKTDYETAIGEGLADISTRGSLWAAYLQLMEYRKAVEASIAAYQTYADAVEYARAYVKEHSDKLEGMYFERLKVYLVENDEPSDVFPHGTALYIMEERQLNDEEVLSEAKFVEQLLKMAIENGYIAGADITSMLRNPQLDGGTEGWETEGTVRVNSGIATATGEFSMAQQMEGIQKDGIYAFIFEGGYRGDVDGYNLNHASFITANDICNYVNMPGEDNPESRNIVVTNVSNNRLKVGVETIGTSSYKETTVSDFRLLYLGTLDEASEALDEVIGSMKMHATTILEKYEFEYVNYYDAPNFSQALKDELQALVGEEPATGEEKYGLICRYSDLFRRIFDCKQAYARMMSFVDRTIDELYTILENGMITEEESTEYQQRLEAMTVAYEDGLYTAAEADENSQWEIHVDINLPQVDGICQLSTADELDTFCQLIGRGLNHLRAQLTNDIDFTEHNAMLGDGTGFAGVLDGQGHSVTVNISGGEDGANYVAFVRDLDGGTLQNLILKGSVASGSLFAGGIAGHTKNNAVLRNIVSEVSMSQIGTAGVAAFGGFVGHIENTLIENCIFAGSIRTVGNSTSGVTGWAANLEMRNCAVIGDIEVGDPTQCFADSRGADIIQDNFYYKTPLSGTFLPATQVTDEQIQNGALCYMLNGDQSKIQWTQLLGEETHPMPFYREEAVVLKQENDTYGNPTGIEEIHNAQFIMHNNDAIYDLSGRRVEKEMKGIYIIRQGGKARKVLVK